MLNKLKHLAKDILAVTWVRKSYDFLNRSVLEVFAAHRLLATVYGVLGFLTFNREQYAVLKGRRNYYRSLTKRRLSHVELRRNVHRIEKGMVMQPRKPVYAKDYIVETMEFYEQAVRQCQVDSNSIDASELEWAYDVLERYFEVVDSGVSPSVDAAREKFAALKPVYSSKSTDKKAPYPHKKIVRSQVSYDDMLQLSMQRRSVRWFKQQPVPRELIDKAMLVGRQAPTACNRLPYEFKIFDDPKLAQKVAGIPFGTAGYSQQVPAVAVVVGKLDSYFSPRDRHAIYVDASLASMSFMFALETLGIGSSVINWPDFEPLEMKMQKTLGLDSSDRVVMLIAFGYPDPDGIIPFSQKKDLQVIRNYNELA